VTKVEIPDCDSVAQGIAAFRSHERRDAIYQTALFLVDHFWGDPGSMANGIGVLLAVWNQAFYRQTNFSINLDDLELVIHQHMAILTGFRGRNILSLDVTDKQPVITLFDQMTEALRCDYDSKSGTHIVRYSSVSTAKALHILAPGFFPLWDSRIAARYGFSHRIESADTYFRFAELMKIMVERLDGCFPHEQQSVLKLIDEYNYAKYVKRWV